MKKVFAEIGFGNDTFLSTEIEEGDSEFRLPKFIGPQRVTGYYIRVWLFRKVFILSTDRGFEMTRKSRNTVKILFGVKGEGV